MLDESEWIDGCLQHILLQDSPNLVEVLVIDGGSTDETVEQATSFHKVRILDNPRRIQAAALNLAIRATTADVIVRVDARTRLSPTYVSRAVAILEATGASMVGGAQVARGEGAWRRLVAEAFNSPLGAGPAAFRDPKRSGWVDTVYLGAFWRTDAVRCGGYDERFSTNEDAEFALRLSKTTSRPVWLDESLACEYVPRSSVAAIARQFYRYGQGRAATVRKHHRVALRQLAPVGLMAALVVGGRPVAVGYAGALGVAAAAVHRRSEAVLAIGVLGPVMHLSWACGFVTGLVRGPTPQR